MSSGVCRHDRAMAVAIASLTWTDKPYDAAEFIEHGTFSEVDNTPPHNPSVDRVVDWIEQNGGVLILPIPDEVLHPVG